jgi:zona occludens toxin (predicted ATPase)
VFPLRSKDNAPAYVTDLSTHRHHGIDLYLITQDAKLVDVWVRRLAARHVHVVRLPGTSIITLTTWNNVVDDPTDHFAQRDGQQERRQLPSHVFGMYKSADLHTPQGKLPIRALAKYAAMAAVVVVLGGYVWSKWGNGQFGRESDDAKDVAKAARDVRAAAADLRDAAQRLADTFKPEIEGLPWSAPFYRQMVVPSTMPILMGCSLVTLDRRTDCRCEDEQGQRIAMTYAQCLDFKRDRPYDFTGRHEQMLAQLAAEVDARRSAGGDSGAGGGGGGGEGEAPAPPPPMSALEASP